MARTVTTDTTFYTFDELDDRAKEKAIEWGSTVVGEDWGTDNAGDVADWFAEGLEAFGLRRDTFEYSYSGFWSQGDGASIMGRFDLPAWILATGNYNTFRKVYIAAKNEGLVFSVVRRHYGYSRYQATTVELDSYLAYVDDEYGYKLAELEEAVKEWVSDQDHDLYRKLEQDYDFETGEERVAEWIEVNAFEFTESGERSVCIAA